MTTRNLALTALLLVAAVAPAAGGVTAESNTRAESSAYAGTHVSFDTQADAVTDYAVDGAVLFESARVQSKSTARSQGSVSLDAGLSALTGLTGSAVSVASTGDVRAVVTAESGARFTAHDNRRGVLVVAGGGQSQYVQVNVSSAAETRAASDSRVVVETDEGAGTFVVVGNGSVAVNDEGNVSASLDDDAKLVFRGYSEGRTESDATAERMIANGTAGAEVYVTADSESDEAVVDAVNYTEDMTVEVAQRSESAVTMTASRSRHEGRVIITSVSDAVVENAENVRVAVDGEAAARASSYSALQTAIRNESASKYAVRGASSADASATVYVAVNHFSTRDVTVSDGTATADETETASDGDGATNGGETTDDAAAESTTGDGVPGFGAGVAAVALVAAALLAVRN